MNIQRGHKWYFAYPHSNSPRFTHNEEDLAEEFAQDITVGVGDTGGRAGIIIHN